MKTRVEAMGVDDTSKEEIVDKEEKENHGLDLGGIHAFIDIKLLIYLNKKRQRRKLEGNNQRNRKRIKSGKYG